MARPLRIEFPGAFYHVTSRGNEQKDVFKSRKDREKFLEYLESATQRYGALVHVWCLMGNHYHLLLETPRGNLSQIMRHINGAYTTYFNVKRKRAGHLFQGRYKAILVEADAYAAQLARYIHLNPVRAGMVQKPQDYPWSSYPCTIGQKQSPPWLERNFILGYFGGSEQGYRAFVEELLENEYASPLQETAGATILGGGDFVARIKGERLKTKKIHRDVPALRQLRGQPDLDAIVERISEAFGESKGASRQAALYVCHRYSGAKLKEIGARFEVSESAVTQASRRFAARLEEDGDVKRAIERVVTELNLSKV